MPPADAVLIALLVALGSAALPLVGWFRAQRRIRHLEMTLLAQSTDGDRYEELRALLEQVAAQTDQLADAQTAIARRLVERMDALPAPRSSEQRPITPH